MRPEIVITGFPKCATTALMQCFEADEDIKTLQTPAGNYEITWPLIKSLVHGSADKILAHKFTAYIYK